MLFILPNTRSFYLHATAAKAPIEELTAECQPPDPESTSIAQRVASQAPNSWQRLPSIYRLERRMFL